MSLCVLQGTGERLKESPEREIANKNCFMVFYVIRVHNKSQYNTTANLSFEHSCAFLCVCTYTYIHTYVCIFVIIIICKNNLIFEKTVARTKSIFRKRHSCVSTTTYREEILIPGRLFFDREKNGNLSICDFVRGFSSLTIR